MKPVLRIPKWREFQHYTDRDSPWIKSYRRLLLDDEWSELSDSSKGHLFGLWLLAAGYEGRIPFKPNWISRQIGANVAINWRELAESKFVALNGDASQVLAELYKDESLRALARIEEEEDKEEKGDKLAKSIGKSEVPIDYAPPVELVERAVRELHLTHAEVKAELSKFINHHRSKGNRFKRIELAFWNWISNRFVDSRRPSSPPPSVSRTVSSERDEIFGRKPQ
jgi:hypothetical protein